MYKSIFYEIEIKKDIVNSIKNGIGFSAETRKLG